MSKVVLVNENDEPQGVMDKMEAHQKGILHRAFSIFIFNSKGEMLIQQRALKKYHSGGLWTNACCSHPEPDEEVEVSAEKRLQEEMGFTTSLTKAFSFVYRTEFNNGLTEHEYDHVYFGNYESDVAPNADEVQDYCYMSAEAVANSIESHPQKYTSWFKIAFPKMMEHRKNT